MHEFERFWDASHMFTFLKHHSEWLQLRLINAVE